MVYGNKLFEKIDKQFIFPWYDHGMAVMFFQPRESHCFSHELELNNKGQIAFTFYSISKFFLSFLSISVEPSESSAETLTGEASDKKLSP